MNSIRDITRENQVRRRKWSVSERWEARLGDREILAAKFACSLRHVRRQGHALTSHQPAGPHRRLRNQECHEVVLAAGSEARFEFFVMVGYVREDWIAWIPAMKAIADRGVDVRLIFDRDCLSNTLIAALRSAEVQFRVAQRFHDKCAVIDASGIQGSFNFTRHSWSRMKEGAIVVEDLEVVFALRQDFLDEWASAVNIDIGTID